MKTFPSIFRVIWGGGGGEDAEAGRSELWVLRGIRAGAELSFERKRISLTGRQLISRAIILQLKTIWGGEERGELTRRGQTVTCRLIMPHYPPSQPPVLVFPIKVTALSGLWCDRATLSQSQAGEGWKGEILHWGPNILKNILNFKLKLDNPFHSRRFIHIKLYCFGLFYVVMSM